MAQANGADEHFKLSVGIAVEGLKALLYINAGAATALIALMEKSQKSAGYLWPIFAFGAGAVVAVIAFGCGYFSQLAYANHRLHHENGNAVEANDALRRHQGWQVMTIGCVAVSIALAIVAIVIAALSQVS